MTAVEQGGDWSNVYTAELLWGDDRQQQNQVLDSTLCALITMAI